MTMVTPTARMLLPLFSAIILTSFINVTMAASVTTYQCDSANSADGSGTDEQVSIAASSAIYPLLDRWANLYFDTDQPQDCSADIRLEDVSGSNAAGSMLCGTSSSSVADAAGMSRPWTSSEAVVLPDQSEGTREYLYQCKRSSRAALQIEIAKEGIALAYHKSSPIAECIRRNLKDALTTEQIRWIFSNWNENEINKSGRDDHAAPAFPDDEPEVKKWSELDPSCPDTPIQLVGPRRDDTKSQLFRSLFFPGFGEDLDKDRYVELDGSLGGGDAVITTASAPVTTQDKTTQQLQEEYLKANDGAITFFGIGTIFSDFNREDMMILHHLPTISDPSSSVIPSIASFQDGTFPYSRNLYINLNLDKDMYEDDHADSLTRKERQLRSFLDFGLTSPLARKAVEEFGLLPLSDRRVISMTTRMQSKSGIPVKDIQEYCRGTIGQPRSIDIAGSTTVFPVASTWADVYQIGCPHVNITVEGGGSTAGGLRVCSANPSDKSLDESYAIDIGDMSRQWRVGKTVSDAGGGLYRCSVGDTSRSIIQTDVAVDGVTVAVREGGVAWRCINEVLGGLTMDQLRWIYSSYSDSQLEEAGWDSNTAIPQSDWSSNTHTWSELHPDCERVEIRIAGAEIDSGTYELFESKVLPDYKNGETFDSERPVFGYFNTPKYEQLVEYLEEHGEAISYFGYGFYFANRGTLSPVPIMNTKGVYVEPTDKTIADGSYEPLTRPIFMNLHNDAASLSNTAPYMLFGMNHPELMEATGYVGVSDEQKQIIIQRILNAPYGVSDDGSDRERLWIILGSVFGGLAFIGIILCCRMRCRGEAEEEKVIVSDTEEGIRASDDEDPSY